MIKILIVQSDPDWLKTFESIIEENLPLLIDYVVYTDSFDHALDLIPKETDLIVIASGSFTDSLSKHRGKVTKKIPDSEKNGDKLAKLIKEINSSTLVCIYSNLPPGSQEYLDRYIPKLKSGDKNLFEVYKILKIAHDEILKI